MRFDLIDLKLFRDVAEAGSITHGAERSHLALAAASTRIRGMEDSLGAKLFTRGRYGVTATAAGQALLVHARTILTQVARLQDDMGAFAKGFAGQVRVLANTNASTEFLPEALSAFLRANPRVSVDLEERLSDEIVGMIAEGAGDIGIVAGTVDVGGLQTFPFRSDRFVLITGLGHPLGQMTRIRFADALRFDIVGLERSSALQRFLADKASRVGLPLRLRVQLRSFDAVCRLVAAGVGIGVVPETTAKRAALTLPLAIVELSDDWAARDLTLCVRDAGELRPFARQLLDHLKAA
ncbi:DNA-binding transcriptional LysR family regulator [Caulobacter ginsengisoli]|uniref:DNA-binding transcriptional LysR family regulator n=1 Tax=Caulobacter ginsengisoli TaxID=400775 RepID=A0ABU0IXN1_9CAUL|nr:LysR substrate-binding domain-containing protein [Caulobacter ginsengisoli]MDQ0466759.1 DNA-binding transcriptional LysR family regulator [Caulobacter ginsengisoli]